MKYTIRKLGFLLLLLLLAAAPFVKTEYDRRTTTDPHILLARDIEENFGRGVDVVNIFQSQQDLNEIVLFVYVQDFPDWTSTERENLKRYVMQQVRGTRYSSIVLGIGWDYTAETIQIQALFVCPELTAASCDYESVSPSLEVKPELVKWPGIGKP